MKPGKRFLAACAAALFLASGAAASSSPRDYGEDFTMDEALDRLTWFSPKLRRDYGSAESALGKRLFFDPRLSRNGAMSCATCHQPSLTWTDGLARARGLNHQLLPRNTPGLSHIALNSYDGFFMDGRAKSIAAAALGAIQNPREMNQDLKGLERAVSSIPDYVRQFRQVYGSTPPVTANLIGKALEAFIASLPDADSRFDRFLKDRKSLSPKEQRGLILFVGKAKCSRCHSSMTFSDDTFHNIGLSPSVPPDPGRYAVDRVPEHLGAFKTPQLRNVALTAPYMHDGRFKTLREVVDFYDRGGDDPGNIDPSIMPLGLAPDDKEALLAFLESLSSAVKPLEVPLLPPNSSL